MLQTENAADNLPNKCVAHGRSDAHFPKVGAIKNSRENGLTEFKIRTPGPAQFFTPPTTSAP